MEVILREHVDNLGRRGDVVKVAPGYARNFLMPRKLALPVNEGNKRLIERERKLAEVRELEERQQAEALASRLSQIERRLKVSDFIIRFLVVRVDEEQAVVERTRTKRTEASRRRRLARGLPADRQPGEGQRGGDDDDRDDRFDMGEGI